MENLIYSNYYTTEAEEDARDVLFSEHGEENGWSSPDDVPDRDIWNQFSLEKRLQWDDEKYELENFFDGDLFLVRGTVGRWNGTFQAGKIVENFRELSDAWRDCDYLKLWDEGGHFYIECSHHDGTNCFEVKRLTSMGKKYLENHLWDDDRELHDKLFSSNFYTALPHYAHTVYGVKKYA